MKKVLTTVLMLVALTFVFGQTLLHYWNFNTGVPAENQSWATPIAATTGSGQISYTFTEAFSFAGTNINGTDGEVNGGSFAPRGGVGTVNNGAHFTVMGSTAGYDNVSISFAARKTSTGFTTIEVLYTTDGSNWITKETIDISSYTSAWAANQVVNVNFGTIPATANNANFGARFVLTGCTSDVGNNRIDNIRVSGALQGGVATPTFDPAGGYFTQPVNVSLATTTPGATIRYTVNGTEPTESSTIYTAPIPVSTTTTIKAKAWATGMVITATATYSFATIVSSLSELRQMPADNSTIYHLPNPVILAYKQSNRNQKFVQDAGAAVLIDDPGNIVNTPYNIGDAISGLTGKLNPYFETLQFLPVSNPGPATSTGNNIVIPTVTIAQLNSDIGIGAYQSRLVYIQQVHFDNPTGTYTVNPSVNFGLSDATGSMTFRTTFWDADYIGTALHTGNFNLRGIVAHFQSTAQITPRMLADFNPPVSNEDEVMVAAGANLIGNYPNPFNPNTNISFSLDKAAPATITIYNQKGQIVKNFDMPMANQGVTTLNWNGTDGYGKAVGSGVYFFRLKSGSYSSTKKMVLMK